MTHTPRKRFGQNFLIDNNIIDGLLAEIQPQPQQHIVEIGPGQGALTNGLLLSGATVDAVEIDRDLAAHLQSIFSTHKNFTLHCLDVLKFSFPDLPRKTTQKLRIVGNLPYNISTPLLFKLFADLNIIQDMFFMLQKEVGDRLIAQPNTKEYGRMSIMAQYFCDMQIIMQVPPSSFNPKPKVDSCIVRFVPHSQPTVQVKDHALLQHIVTSAFNHRRKTIANSLKDFITATELTNLHIDPQARAENLSLIDYTNIVNYLTR